MKISYNWLRKFLPDLNAEYSEIGEKLTLHTAELEENIKIEKHFKNVFLGKFIEQRAHKKAEKLTVGIFDLGKKIGKKQIIFGQVHKISVGEILPIALEGAQLKSGINIHNTEIKGEKSEGMVCDNTELGFSFGGLLRLSEEKMIGKPIFDVCEEMRDILFDIDNKSLTHRPDLMGIRGFAREIAAIFNTKLILPEPLVSMPSEPLEKVEVEIKSDDCRRFCAIKIDQVNVAPSNYETQVRLENLDIRSISNLVDITNLILLEFGQPMHVFDADKVVGKILVRKAEKGETLVALDGNKYELTEDDLVIADEEKVLSVAGIMGGEFSSVSDTTTSIIFECANFNPTTIRKTSQRLGLRSESSMRYEKSLDANKCKKAIFAAVEKALEMCPAAQIVSQITDEFPIKSEPKKIILNPEKVRQVSGIKISNKEIKDILEKIDFRVFEKEGEKDLFEVRIPSFRATKDVNIAEDLIEEVVRLYGFFNIQSELPMLPAEPPRRNLLRDLEWTIKEFLAQNYLEVYNYNFTNKEDKVFTGEDDYVEISNPLSTEHTHLRKTLISNLVKNLESELRTHGEVNLFEFGHTYKSQKGEVLPLEELNFAIFSAKINGDENETFYDTKAKLIQLFALLKLEKDLEILPLEAWEIKPYMHPSKSAKIVCKGEKLGVISVLHPQFLPIKNSHVVFTETNVRKLQKFVQQTEIKYRKLSAFPFVYRDLSIVLEDKKLVAEIEKTVFSVAKNLKKIELFDEYKDDKKLGKGLKNLAFHLAFRSDEKTLEEKDVTAEFEAIVAALEKKLGATLRLAFDAKNK